MERKQLVDTMMIAIGQALSNTHTATIGKVISVGEKTIDVQPVINRVVNGESIELPVFKKVPPIFLGGGASSLTMPIAEGDYALLIFTERCYDRWWNGQDNQSPLELRMHDYSDGFALVGLQPESSALSIPGDMTITGDLIIDGNMTITGDLIIDGNLTVNGEINADNVSVPLTGDVTVGTISLKTHTHLGVTPGGGISGPPSP